MPIETDIGNLKKRVEDACEEIDAKILEKEAELEILTDVQNKKEILLCRIDKLSEDIDEFLEETQEID